MTEKLTMHTKDLVQENVERIGELFPNCITETMDSTGNVMKAIDFEALKRQLSDEVISEGKERYVFTWPGKSEAQHLANTQSNLTLRPVRAESVDFDTTQNIYIEGDNLEALKLLRETYLGKIKLIYIDPPYNTGHDFVYNDNFSQEIGAYNEVSGDFDESGNRLVQNTTSNGRFHSDWLNMLYPRLLLARDLLSSQGAIFISIDDNEVTNLRKICDEIFGESNIVAQFPWQSRQSVQNDTDVSVNHEYVVAYAKCRRQENRRLKESNVSHWFLDESFVCLPTPLDPESFSNPDNDPRGPWKTNPFDAPNVRPNLTYEIVNPVTGEKHLPPAGRHWATEPEKYQKLLKDGRILFGKDGRGRPQLKVFYEEKKMFGSIDNSWWTGEICGTTTQGTKELMSIFGGKTPFDTPKPVKLIEKIIKLTSRQGSSDIILDFFGGSSTTADAVMKSNISDGSHRRFILVQLPEEVRGGSEFNTISEIGRERIRRVGSMLKEANKDIDCGFRAYRIDSSNMTDVFYNPQMLKKDILDYASSNIKSDRTSEDLLVQVMLEMGIELSAAIVSEIISGKEIMVVDNGYLIACFDENITDEVVTEIAKKKPTHVVFRDSSMANDSVAINFEQIFKAYSPNTKTRVL